MSGLSGVEGAGIRRWIVEPLLVPASPGPRPVPPEISVDKPPSAHTLRALFQKDMPLAFYLAQGQPPQPPRDDPSSMLVLFGAVMVIMWVLMIRPQQKRQKELAARISALKTGDRVVTIGGVHGTVSNVKDGPTLLLKVDDNCKLTVDKSSIATVLSKDIEKPA
jgi:preprotein translocase subunit YajC